MRYIDPDGNDWKDAYPHLENAISANVSIGWRLSANFQVWGAKVGIDADAGSVKIGNDGIRATKGASIDLGIGGAGTYQEAYEINDKYSALEEGTSWNFLMLKETTNKTTIYDSTGKYFKEVHHKEEKKEKRGSSLTVTECEILKLMALGKTTKEIAAERFLSVYTVMTHRKNIFRKLEVNNVYEATKYALRAGIVDAVEYYI